jgi:hypothetical protein
MPKTTYADKINSFIEEKKLRVPRVTQKFVTRSISRLSNGQNRPSSNWTRDNKEEKEQVLLRTLSWVGKLRGWHIDHINPISKGGSYNVSNLRLLPPALNRILSDLGWSHEKLNDFVKHLGPRWRKELNIPEDFESCPAEEFLQRLKVGPEEPQTFY